MRRAAARQSPTSFAAELSGKTTVRRPPRPPQADPWTDIADYPANVMDNRVVNLDGKVYSIAGGNGSGVDRRTTTSTTRRRRPGRRSPTCPAPATP